MKKLVLLLVATVAIVWAQSVQTVTIPALEITDATQIRGLSYVTKNYNDANPTNTLTREAYAQKVMQDALNSWAKAEADALYAKAQAVYQNASPQGQGQILAALGLGDRTYGF